MKKLLLAVFVVEVLLSVAWLGTEEINTRREVMFDPARREFYDLLSRHCFNCLIAVPLIAIGFVLLRRIRSFAVMPLSLRVGASFLLVISLYSTVWFIGNSELFTVRPRDRFLLR